MEVAEGVPGGNVGESAPDLRDGGFSFREAAWIFGPHRDTVLKIVICSVPQG